MMIVWTTKALNDLDNLYVFYKDKSEKVAINIYNSIVHEVDILSDFPYLAPVEPYLQGEAKTFRSLVVLSGLIKIIYYVENEKINITHVWDCRKNPLSLKSSI